MELHQIAQSSVPMQPRAQIKRGQMQQRCGGKTKIVHLTKRPGKREAPCPEINEVNEKFWHDADDKDDEAEREKHTHELARQARPWWTHKQAASRGHLRRREVWHKCRACTAWNDSKWLRASASDQNWTQTASISWHVIGIGVSSEQEVSKRHCWQKGIKHALKIETQQMNRIKAGDY